MLPTLFIALFFDPYSQDGVVRVRSKFLAVHQPSSGNAVGLHESFTKALSRVGIENWKQKLVGFGCDGASVNMGANGLRGLLEQDVPWIISFWCLIHRLQLALKDSLKSTYFASVDEMLTQLYLLYEKSPKKCRELDEIVESLRMCISIEDLPSAGGNRPLRACGTRFVGHKVSALNRLVDRYGAYLAHILELTEDPRVKATDKQRLKGYYKKWHDGRIILASAFFHDVLKPCATLSLALQAEHVNVIDAIEAVLRTKKSMEQLKSTIFSELPTVKKVMSRVHKSGNNITYQETELVRYDEAVTYLTLSKDNVIEGIMACLKDRLTVHHPQLLKDCLTLLATHGWQRSTTDNFADTALDNVLQTFSVPLENAGVDVSTVSEEWKNMLEYAKQYLNLVQESSDSIWWKLFNASCKSRWSNVLSLVQLLFCLPMANGHVERTISILKLKRRNSLSEDHLDDLMRISVDGPPLSQWDATPSVHLWWKDKQR